jgi:hypothetical protein
MAVVAQERHTLIHREQSRCLKIEYKAARESASKASDSLRPSSSFSRLSMHTVFSDVKDD